MAKAAVLAKVSKGLKIGGWAAFVVITGYQLITATPEERPRVVTAAAGGLAGGVVGSYVVCNLIFGLETLGWSLLFCGLVAGGAGGYVGSEVAGDIYDEATRTKLQEALQKLDASPRNVRILFNAVVNRLGPDGLPIDDSFVNRFLAIVPSDLRNYELIVLAGRFAAAAGVRAPKQPTAAQKAATHAPTTSFPTFTQRSDCKVNCHRGADDLRGFDVIDGRPVFSAEDFANMEKWIELQPQVTPDNEDVGPKGKPAPKSHEGEVHLPTPGSGYPSMKDQAGTCPGGCHKPASALSRPKINIKPERLREHPQPAEPAQHPGEGAQRAGAGNCAAAGTQEGDARRGVVWSTARAASHDRPARFPQRMGAARDGVSELPSPQRAEERAVPQARSRQRESRRDHELPAADASEEAKAGAEA